MTFEWRHDEGSLVENWLFSKYSLCFSCRIWRASHAEYDEAGNGEILDIYGKRLEILAGVLRHLPK